MRSEDAARYAPILVVDEREPFTPARVGYSLMEQSGPSPSFLREITLEPPAVSAIEYAFWWEWDIGHLYDLEHIWVYLDASGAVVGCEGSWHGFYQPIEIDGAVPLEGDHPAVVVLPGKHACVSTPADLEPTRAETERACGPDAGREGLLIPHLFLGRLNKNPADDERIHAYLQSRAFTPAWRFNRRIDITSGLHLPWADLFDLIPVRIEYWLGQLRTNQS